MFAMEPAGQIFWFSFRSQICWKFYKRKIASEKSQTFFRIYNLKTLIELKQFFSIYKIQYSIKALT